jgi:hypothetical protein
MDVSESDKTFEIHDLSMVVVREPQPEAVQALAVEDIGLLPSAVRVTPFESNRRIIIYILLITLCVATLLSLVAVLFENANGDAAIAVVAPLSTLAAAVVFFYFPRKDG